MFTTNAKRLTLKANVKSGIFVFCGKNKRGAIMKDFTASVKMNQIISL